MKKIFLLVTIIFIGCSPQTSNQQINNFNSKENLNSLIDTYLFLSNNHDLLHIMMGEYDGSPIDSYNTYKEKIKELENNLYAQPILSGLNTVTVKNNSLKNADKFDALVDYYQMGLQIMIEGILKGYGYEDEMPQNSTDYEEVKKLSFN